MRQNKWSTYPSSLKISLVCMTVLQITRVSAASVSTHHIPAVKLALPVSYESRGVVLQHARKSRNILDITHPARELGVPHCIGPLYYVEDKV